MKYPRPSHATLFSPLYVLTLLSLPLHCSPADTRRLPYHVSHEREPGHDEREGTWNGGVGIAVQGFEHVDWNGCRNGANTG